MMSIRNRINAAVKAAMIAKNKERLITLRILSAALKQIEIDQRIDITDEVATNELVRQVKQRRESAKQFRQADRKSLAEKEEAEIEIIQEFLPKAMSEADMKAFVDKVVQSSNLPKEIKSMGPLMAKLKPELTGKVDMALVSAYLRQILNS